MQSPLAGSDATVQRSGSSGMLDYRSASRLLRRLSEREAQVASLRNALSDATEAHRTTEAVKVFLSQRLAAVEGERDEAVAAAEHAAARAASDREVITYLDERLRELEAQALVAVAAAPARAEEVKQALALASLSLSGDTSGDVSTSPALAADRGVGGPGSLAGNYHTDGDEPRVSANASGSGGAHRETTDHMDAGR